MRHKTVIVILLPDVQAETGTIKQTPELWGNLKKACHVHGWKYNTLSRKGNQFKKDNHEVFRLQFSEADKTKAGN
jgi:hypothetical protein